MVSDATMTTGPRRYRLPGVTMLDIAPFIKAAGGVNAAPCLGARAGHAAFRGVTTERVDFSPRHRVFVAVEFADVPWNAIPFADDGREWRDSAGNPLRPPVDFEALGLGGTAAWVEVDGDGEPVARSWRDRPPML